MSGARPQDDVVRRIVVVLDPSAEGISALEFAADLAAALGISLAGVFIEDVAISEFAELPFAREVSLPGAGVHALSRQRMQSYYRAAADRARQALENLGRMHHIPCSFEWRRGRLESELSAAAREWDVIVMSTAAGHVVRPRGHDILGPLQACSAAGFLAFTRPVPVSTVAGVLTVFTGSPEAYRAVAVAARVAAQRHTTLTVLDSGPQAPHPDETIRHLGIDAARLEIVRTSIRLSDFLRMRTPAPRLIVLPADVAATERDAVRGFDIPTLVIRATREPAAGEAESRS
jgi:nucleotide-binding universal stress UspA family protein